MQMKLHPRTTWLFFCVNLALATSFDVRALLSERFENVVINANFGQFYEQHVNAERRVYFIFNSSMVPVENSSLAIRFEVQALNVNISTPLLMTVERTESIFSWQLPIKISNSSYFHFTRTLCPEWVGGTSANFALFGFSSSSLQNVSLHFTASLRDLSLRVAENNFTTTPSSPVYFFYKMPRDADSVVVRAESSDGACAILSIQNAVCPVYDMVGITEHSRYHATMTKKGAITVTRNSLKSDSFFIVISVEPDNYEDCALMEDILPVGNSKSKVFASLEVRPSISVKQLMIAILVGLACFFVVYLFTFIALVINHYKYQRVVDDEDENKDDDENEVLIVDHRSRVESTYGSCNRASADGEEIEEDFVAVEVSNEFLWAKPVLCVSDMMKERTSLVKKQRTFFCDLFTLAIFYFLPAVQLVFNFQKTLNNTGNQDICYYNFYCIHQLGVIAAFNSFFSNVGYVMLGSLFLYLVYRREKAYMECVAMNGSMINFGIPQRYDLFYAMGLALVVEGLLSGCYHICPSYNNFQFDTSFMYMIGWLCMLKIYQNRHQDMSLRAHVAYSIIAFIVLFEVIGITEGTQAFWICFVVAYLLFILYLSLQVYYLGHWKSDWRIICRIWTRIRYEKSLWKPVYLDKLLLLIFGNLVNWALAIYGALLMPKNFASYLLSIMLANFMMYFLFYIIMKIRHKERIYLLSYLLLSLSTVFWVASLYFFFNHLSMWELSPALSREHNSDCLWMEFYDHHDIWHFLSALSLFFSFLLLLTLDDGLHNVPRNQIKVF